MVRDYTSPAGFPSTSLSTVNTKTKTERDEKIGRLEKEEPEVKSIGDSLRLNTRIIDKTLHVNTHPSITLSKTPHSHSHSPHPPSSATASPSPAA